MWVGPSGFVLLHVSLTASCPPEAGSPAFSATPARRSVPAAGSLPKVHCCRAACHLLKGWCVTPPCLCLLAFWSLLLLLLVAEASDQSASADQVTPDVTSVWINKIFCRNLCLGSASSLVAGFHRLRYTVKYQSYPF